MAKQIEPYKAAITLNHEILNLVEKISFSLGKLSVLVASPLKIEIPSSVKFSLLNEGIVLTASQIRTLNRLEETGNPKIDGLVSLYKRIGKIDPVDPSFREEYEKVLYPEGVPTRLGRKAEGFPYPLPMHNRVEAMMKGLLSYGKKSEISPLFLACVYYMEIYAIAPYSSENGILARYLFKLSLGKKDRAFYAIPLEKYFYERKASIAEAFDKTISNGDSAPLFAVLLSLVSSSVDALIRQQLKKEPTTNALVEKLLERMEEGRYYSANELCALLGLKSRLGLQKNYLRPGLEGGVLKMSNPLVPTDRNQRYCKN